MAEQNGTARWQLWVSGAGLILAIFGGMTNLYLLATSANEKVISLEARVAGLERSVGAQDREIKVLCTTLREVETQFRASDQVRNTMQASNIRTDALLWSKAFGTDFPIANAYYPTIAQENPAPCA